MDRLRHGVEESHLLVLSASVNLSPINTERDTYE